MKKLLIAAAVIAAFLQACSDGFKTSDDGLQYQIHTENSGEKIKVGDVVTLQMVYRLLQKKFKIFTRRFQ